MKTSFRKNKVWLLIIIIFLVIFLINVFIKEVKGFFYSFSLPIQKVFYQAGDSTSDFLLNILKTQDLKDKADQLEIENQGLKTQVVNSGELEEENKSLKQALSIELDRDFKLSLGEIIGKDISQDFIMIDKGTRDGILKDMPVITEQKILIGKISEAYDRFSKIMLISSKESSFDAQIMSLPSCSGVIKGRGDSKLLFELIPQEEMVSQGDVVVSSVLGGIFPNDLLVGEVKAIRKSDLESFQIAEIEPFFDISQIKNVFIILDF
jgi:rod shape-determining protein MreC